MTESLADFLSRTPQDDGVYQLSAPRPFQHDEAQYELNRPAARKTTEFHREQGANLFALFRRHGLPPNAPILEIGCGSGAMSTSLATQPGAGHLLFTDPSPAFCRITQGNLEQHGSFDARVDFGILRAEDVDILPPGSVHLIFLRSVLHHILDVDDFLLRCSRVLPPGGLLVCEEPYYEGYMMMGFLGQFIADALASAGDQCTPEELHHIDYFIATMQYYARRDLDKSEAEDKHLFQPDQLFVSGRAVGLDLTHYPNWHVTVSEEKNLANRIGYFQKFFDSYLRNCMHWPPDLVDRVAVATGRYFRFFDPLESPDNTVPYCFGTFVFTKRR